MDKYCTRFMVCGNKLAIENMCWIKDKVYCIDCYNYYKDILDAFEKGYLIQIIKE